MVVPLRRERGAVAIQAALVLPILVVLMIGAFEIWKVLYMQQVLNDAAYQGVRLVCLQGYHQRQFNPSQLEGDIPDEAEVLVRRYVARAPFVDPAVRDNLYDDSLDVRIGYADDFAGPVCGAGVWVDVYLDWWVGRGWSGGDSASWMPFLDQLGTLHGRANGLVVCERMEDL